MNKIYSMSFLLGFFLFLPVKGQEQVELSNAVRGKVEVSATKKIKLKPGFKAKKGSQFKAFISADANNTGVPQLTDIPVSVSMSSSPSTGENYVRESLLPGTSMAAQTITYIDGLGRPIQKIQVKASPSGKDVVQHIDYDEFGRESKQFLPYVSKGNGEYRKHAETETFSYYQNELEGKDKKDDFPFSQTEFENSPLNRVMATQGAGQDWRTNKRKISLDYQTNTSQLDSWDENGAPSPFKARSLYITQTTDENNVVSREYKNMQGKVVLTETIVDGVPHKTHYIYDDYGLLRTVVTPQASSPADVELCYFYKYDGRKRLISKKIPGADWVEMIYDARDRLVLVQDGNLRFKDNEDNTQYFRFTKYDALNRPVMTGILKYTNHLSDNSLDRVREDFNTHDNLFETYDGTNAYGYSLNKSFPIGYSIKAEDIETVTWYDTYDFINAMGKETELTYHTNDIPQDFNRTRANTIGTKGLVTGSMLKALPVENGSYAVSAPEMYMVSYYDPQGNVIQSISTNQRGGRDITSNHYEQTTWKLLQTQQQHWENNKLLVKTLEKYEYDHAGRLLATKHKVNEQDEITLTAMRYNELGELIKKYMHGKDGQFVQKVDYTYNIRGWLRSINDPRNIENDAFAMELNYHNGVHKSFNGNISSMLWYTLGDKLRAYNFQYDDLNRLINADYAEGADFASNKGAFSVEIPEYDKNGNIIQLRRRYEGADMDKLTYLYNEASNKLKKIEEKATGSFAIPNYSLESPRSYTYDVNGNMTYDPSMNKYVTYNDLNLPESVGGLYTGKSFYHYDASGTKLAKSIETADGAIGNVTSYVGNLIFEGKNLAFVLHSEGRLVPDAEGKWNYEYNMKDHLGNTRAVIAGSIMGGKVDLIQESHYYPFGLSFKTKDYSSIGNKFLFNGKELQDETGWYDFGARHQDRKIGRWHVIDPAAEMFQNLSVYNYAFNNPVRFIDPDGMVTQEGGGTDPTKLYGKRINMANAPARGYNAAGFPRNGPWFWKQMLAQNPEMFDKANQIRIKNNQAPHINEQWIKHNPSHAAYEGRLVHHHIDQGKMATGIPERAHQRFSKQLHSFFRNNKGIGKGTLSALGGLVLALDFFSDNPHSTGSMLETKKVNKLYYDSDSENYYEITSKTLNMDDSGNIESADITMDVYSNYAYDEDQGKYVGTGEKKTVSSRVYYGEEARKQFLLITGGGS